jgi:hypothetical protein
MARTAVPCIDMGRPTLAIAAALLTLTACGRPAPAPAAASSPPAAFTITGAVNLDVGNFTWDSDTMSCAGKDGYDDLAPGAQTIVTDPAGTTIAVGQITTGKAQMDDDDGQAASCALSFVVNDVPAGKGFYGIEVSHRGRLQYSELQAHGILQLSVG